MSIADCNISWPCCYFQRRVSVAVAASLPPGPRTPRPGRRSSAPAPPRQSRSPSGASTSPPSSARTTTRTGALVWTYIAFCFNTNSRFIPGLPSRRESRLCQLIRLMGGALGWAPPSLLVRPSPRPLTRTPTCSTPACTSSTWASCWLTSKPPTAPPWTPCCCRLSSPWRPVTLCWAPSTPPPLTWSLSGWSRAGSRRTLWCRRPPPPCRPSPRGWPRPSRRWVEGAGRPPVCLPRSPRPTRAPPPPHSPSARALAASNQSQSRRRWVQALSQAVEVTSRTLRIWSTGLTELTREDLACRTQGPRSRPEFHRLGDINRLRQMHFKFLKNFDWKLINQNMSHFMITESNLW